MRGARSAIVFSVLLYAGCKAEHAVTDQAEHALNLIGEEALRSHVAWLADDARMGRAPGEPGYDAAARYVTEQLAAMRVEPAGNDGWYQPVELRSYRIDPGSPEMRIHRDDEDIDLKFRDDFTMSPDAIRETTDVRAEVVFVGHGVHAPEHGYSDYEGVDVKGRVVAMFRGAPEAIEGSERAWHASSRVKRSLAVSRGAVGIITLRTSREERRNPWEKMARNAGKRPSMSWVTADGRASGYFSEILGAATVSPSTAEQLFEHAPFSFDKAHAATASGDAISANLNVEISLAGRSLHDSISSPNVIGRVRGTDPELADEYVVYTAHLDHIGVIEQEDEQEDGINNGAYDNAMGIALMLETARVIAAAPPKRSVLFIALTAEENGLLGSDYFVNSPTVPIESIVANVNLDMPLFLYPLGDLVAFGSQHSSLHDIVERSAADEGFAFSPDPLPEENLFIRSDQYSFVRKGVPAVFLVPGFTSLDEQIDGEALFRDHLEHHYHKPSDDTSRPVDWDSAVRFARAHTRIGYLIAQQQDRPRWNDGDFFGDRYGR